MLTVLIALIYSFMRFFVYTHHKISMESTSSMGKALAFLIRQLYDLFWSSSKTGLVPAALNCTLGGILRAERNFSLSCDFSETRLKQQLYSNTVYCCAGTFRLFDRPLLLYLNKPLLSNSLNINCAIVFAYKLQY